MNEILEYSTLLQDIKERIRKAQIKAVLSVNAEMIFMYWDIGKIIFLKQKQETWGSKVIQKLSKDIHNELPEIKGFSIRNIIYMVRLYKEYEHDFTIVQQLVAQIPWGHNLLLMEKIEQKEIRTWYIEQTIQNGWSRDILGTMIKNDAYKRQGSLTNNFQLTLPKPQSDLALQTMKDPYIFDFLTLTEPFQERELETELIKHLEKFLIELGAGFSFVGRQYHLVVSDQDFYLDLLFYHLKLRAFVIIELKKGEFKPEYAGKMNFYCSAVDDLLKQKADQPTIGLVLCQTKDRIFAEYSLRDIHKPIGISEYDLTRVLPDNLKSSLPSIEDIESELNKEIGKGEGAT